MKKAFFDAMNEMMHAREDVFLLMAGLGYPRVDEFLKDFPGRALNTEASEQTALDMAVGLALSGKKPFVYTITPFLFRGWETIRSYINHQELPITLIGVGRDDEYSLNDGFSHYAGDMERFMSEFENIDRYYPADDADLIQTMYEAYLGEKPVFINIRR